MGASRVEPSVVDEHAVNASIGERVHTAMWRARITQTQMAKAIGVDQAAISRRLRGRAPWKVSDLIIAAQLCGVTVEDLMPQLDELGHIGGLTRDDGRAESRCTQARANRTSLGHAAQAWGAAALLPGQNDNDDDAEPGVWAVAR